MTTVKIPHNALIVVADGTGARFFRNSGQKNKVSLSADGDFKPTNLLNAGPAGKRPRESSDQETDEATFSKQLANELYRRAHSGALRSARPHCRSTDLGPNTPVIAQRGPGSAGVRDRQNAYERIYHRYSEGVELALAVAGIFWTGKSRMRDKESLMKGLDRRIEWRHWDIPRVHGGLRMEVT